MGNENSERNVKPGRKARVFKPKSQITEVSRSEFEDAKNDPGVAAFFKRAEEEGDQLESEGLIHR